MEKPVRFVLSVFCHLTCRKSSGSLVFLAPTAQSLSYWENPLFSARLSLHPVSSANTSINFWIPRSHRESVVRLKKSSTGNSVPPPPGTLPWSMESWNISHNQLQLPNSLLPSLSRKLRWFSGKLCPVSTCKSGKGILQDRKPFDAKSHQSDGYLPPEKKQTGAQNCAATSRGYGSILLLLG